MKKITGIIGGMGPLATHTLFGRIIALTSAVSDQEHLRIIIDNNTEIPDRTECILRGGQDPLPFLTDSARRLEQAGAGFLIMPCNTAHYFYDGICASVNIPVLHMIKETLNALSHLAKDSSIGLLATEGTVNSGIYHDIFRNRYRIETPDKSGQQTVTELIYDIKAGKKNINIKPFQSVADGLFSAGCSLCILGCTELSVAAEMFELKGDFTDPLTVIAKKAIMEAGGTLL